MRKWLANFFSSDELSQDRIDTILEHARIPEHIPALMASISKGKLFFEQGFLGIHQNDWLILTGYPVTGEFSVHRLEVVIHWALSKYSPASLWLIAPQLPVAFSDSAVLLQNDQYYQLDLVDYHAPAALRRIVERTRLGLKVDISQVFTSQHQELIEEFMARQALPPLVAALYENIPGCLAASSALHLFNARDQSGRLTAFFAVDQSAKQFDAYLLGCFSRSHYIVHASDCLFWEMIACARSRGKSNLQLGLGVNPGIRRFKQKWGGQPFLDYFAWELHFGSTAQQSLETWISEGKW